MLASLYVLKSKQCLPLKTVLYSRVVYSAEMKKFPSICLEKYQTLFVDGCPKLLSQLKIPTASMKYDGKQFTEIFFCYGEICFPVFYSPIVHCNDLRKKKHWRYLKLFDYLWHKVLLDIMILFFMNSFCAERQTIRMRIKFLNSGLFSSLEYLKQMKRRNS